MSKDQVVLLSGGSSGIGRQTALALKEKGFRVYEISRRLSEIPGIVHIGADVTQEDSLKAAVSQVIEAEGRIDVLINNAGFGISGAVEFTRTEDAQKQLDVNFFGMDRLTRAVLPHMRHAGRGRIINLSSVAAVIPIPFQTYYSVSKAAINAYTLALANEVRPYGIAVCAVMPGDIRTGFTAAREKTVLGDDTYCGRIARSVARMERDEEKGMAPSDLGRYIAHLASKRRVKPLYSLGLDYRLFLFLARVLPSGVLNRLVYLLYGK